MNDTELLAQCQLKSFQGSGPGGQHRNKTNTGVHLKLLPFNLEIRCCEDRSAMMNRLHALSRLRIKLALQIRSEVGPILAFPGSNGHINPDNKAFPAFLAQVFDHLEIQSGEIRPVAELWKLSPSALLRILGQEKSVWEALQTLRRKYDKPPLH